MYLYQIDKELIVSETKRPDDEGDKYRRHSEGLSWHDFNVSEWQKNLIPVKEGEERKFMRLAQELIPNVPNVVLKATLNEALQNGIKMPDEAVDFRNECYKPHEPIKLFAYLNNQPKKEESNEAIEKNDFNLLPKLLKFTNKYNITVQFWTEQTAVFIEKDGIDLIDYGGDFNDTIQMAIDYLNRITKNKLK